MHDVNMHRTHYNCYQIDQTTCSGDLAVIKSPRQIAIRSVINGNTYEALEIVNEEDVYQVSFLSLSF